jgi:hypothetical protein
MEKYTFDLLPEDIGEIVTMIRVQHLRLHAEPFAKKLGVQEKMLLSVEDGKGPHGMLLLKKINEVFPNVNVTVNVELL